jgi:hypothetical protein
MLGRSTGGRNSRSSIVMDMKQSVAAGGSPRFDAAHGLAALIVTKCFRSSGLRCKCVGIAGVRGKNASTACSSRRPSPLHDVGASGSNGQARSAVAEVRLWQEPPRAWGNKDHERFAEIEDRAGDARAATRCGRSSPSWGGDDFVSRHAHLTAMLWRGRAGRQAPAADVEPRQRERARGRVDEGTERWAWTPV